MQRELLVQKYKSEWLRDVLQSNATSYCTTSHLHSKWMPKPCQLLFKGACLHTFNWFSMESVKTNPFKQQLAWFEGSKMGTQPKQCILNGKNWVSILWLQSTSPWTCFLVVSASHRRKHLQVSWKTRMLGSIVSCLADHVITFSPHLGSHVADHVITLYIYIYIYIKRPPY